MKTLHFYSYTLALFATFFLASCTSEALEDTQRQNVAEVFASKQIVLSLPLEEQKQVWISRLEMYFELELSPAQKGILNEMVSDLKEMGNGKFFMSENLKRVAVAMAKITPREDFLKLFCEVTASLPILRKSGPLCAECINDLENYVSPKTNYDDSVTFRSAPDCDCLWTCQQQEDDMLCPDGQYATTVSPCQGSQETGCCNQTASGCGFLLLSSCTGYVECQNN